MGFADKGKAGCEKKVFRYQYDGREPYDSDVEETGIVLTSPVGTADLSVVRGTAWATFEGFLHKRFVLFCISVIP